MFDRWNSFKDKILIYFKRHIHNEDCKRQLLDVERANVDAQDYLTLILLNAVLPPTSRILNQNGKRNQKPTIADAQLSMVLWLSSLNDYERRINNIVREKYLEGTTI
ncbi:uncharacterized protein [Drosophila suzukii]|uniref:Uncharacterized protein n=1 Tax=Drosophila suzukii TaxID=28584 RepID=A0ABM4TYX4_DROSZ|nr:uncharacterized protein LOC118879491 [Drosophila suzukii]